MALSNHLAQLSPYRTISFVRLANAVDRIAEHGILREQRLRIRRARIHRLVTITACGRRQARFVVGDERIVGETVICIGCARFDILTLSKRRIIERVVR